MLLQGREHEVIVLSLVWSNSGGRLGHVDDGCRLNATLTRATHALVVIGVADALKHGYERGLTSFIRNVYERGLLIQTTGDQVGVADFLGGDAKKVAMNLTEARSIADDIHVCKSTKLEIKIVQIGAASNPLAKWV